jgi:hypothetical protein
MNLNSTKPKEIRRFGLVALVFFGTLAGLGIWRQKVPAIAIFGVLALLGAGMLVLPKPLQPVYTTWLKITHAIGKAVTTLMLTLAYYLVITPFGVVQRLFGHTLMPLKPDKEADSYWVKRPEAAQPVERFYKRY